MGAAYDDKGKSNVNNEPHQKRNPIFGCTKQRHGLLGMRIFRQEACHPSGLGTNRLLPHTYQLIGLTVSHFFAPCMF
jgi:hypothetical protein